MSSVLRAAPHRVEVVPEICRQLKNSTQNARSPLSPFADVTQGSYRQSLGLLSVALPKGYGGSARILSSLLRSTLQDGVAWSSAGGREAAAGREAAPTGEATRARRAGEAGGATSRAGPEGEGARGEGARRNHSWDFQAARRRGRRGTAHA